MTQMNTDELNSSYRCSSASSAVESSSIAPERAHGRTRGLRRGCRFRDHDDCVDRADHIQRSLPGTSRVGCKSMADSTLLTLLDVVRGKTLAELQGLDERHARSAPPNLQTSCLSQAGRAYVATEFLTMKPLGRDQLRTNG